MFTPESYQEEVDSNLRKIRLTEHVISDVHAKLIVPIYSDDKADLLIAVENLAESVFLLLEEVRGFVWNESLQEPSSES